jgi:hypothetical protein
MSRPTEFGRRWWPAPALIAVAIALQQVAIGGRYNVSGHAGEHLSSATVAFPAFAFVAILLYATPAARRQPLVLAASALWLASTVLVLVGNIRVVDALIDAGMADVSTSQLVATDAIADAHDLADLAPWLGVLTALAMTGLLWRGRHITGRVAVGAAILSVIVPPWIIPGAGVIVITVARCMSHQRTARADGTDSGGASGSAGEDVGAARARLMG